MYLELVSLLLLILISSPNCDEGRAIYAEIDKGTYKDFRLSMYRVLLFLIKLCYRAKENIKCLL